MLFLRVLQPGCLSRLRTLAVRGREVFRMRRGRELALCSFSTETAGEGGLVLLPCLSPGL